MTTTPSPEQQETATEQPFVTHLLELRTRLMRIVGGVLLLFLCLFPFGNDIYTAVAGPLMAVLPEGTSMIATQVASPFLTPFKLALVAAVFLSMPLILHQLWGFVAPGLYQHERRLALPLLGSSILLFYAGMAFAYFVVFPLVFAFFTATAPEGVAVMTDISAYLDFVLTLFFAFGIAFEVPIATILLVLAGITTPKQLAQKRPYVIVGAFVVGMLLTPPDVISQTLLALPVWMLFELGILFSRIFARGRKGDEGGDAAGEGEDDGDDNGPGGSDLAMASGPTVSTDSAPSTEHQDDGFVPMTEAELDAELDRIEAEEGAGEEGERAATPAAQPADQAPAPGDDSASEDGSAAAADEAQSTPQAGQYELKADKPGDPFYRSDAEESDAALEKQRKLNDLIHQANLLRENMHFAAARKLLEEVLEAGEDSVQADVARDILEQIKDE